MKLIQPFVQAASLERDGASMPSPRSAGSARSARHRRAARAINTHRSAVRRVPAVSGCAGLSARPAGARPTTTPTARAADGAAAKTRPTTPRGTELATRPARAVQARHSGGAVWRGLCEVVDFRGVDVAFVRMGRAVYGVRLTATKRLAAGQFMARGMWSWKVSKADLEQLRTWARDARVQCRARLQDGRMR
jgi:hypothetical protein